MVFVVEDHPHLREFIAECLRGAGHEVRVAPDGRQALADLRASAETPDLILLDLVMPQMDGWSFRTEQLRDPRLAAVPVVVLTGGAGVPPPVAIAGYLRKPVDRERLLEMVRRFCAERPPSSPSERVGPVQPRRSRR